MGRFALVVFVAACSGTGSQPSIATVEPPTGPTSKDTFVQIHGAFDLPIVSNLDNGTTQVGDVSARVGGTALVGAQWRNSQLVVGTVPAGIAVGTYDVTVALGSQEDVLAGGYEVTAGLGAGTDAGTDALTCPAGYDINAFGGCYRESTTPRTWQDAERDCEVDGGHLVVVDDIAENLALPIAVEHWFGYSETITDGTFLWVTGSAGSGFEGWATGEPGTTIGGNCAVTRLDGWHDDICTELKVYLCEYDGKPADPSTWQ